jgi:hypothetical protein
MTYDPRIGRWTSEDPSGFTAADPNLYRYVKNSPINLTDPSGLEGGPPGRLVGAEDTTPTKKLTNNKIKMGDTTATISVAIATYTVGGVNQSYIKFQVKLDKPTAKATALLKKTHWLQTARRTRTVNLDIPAMPFPGYFVTVTVPYFNSPLMVGTYLGGSVVGMGGCITGVAAMTGAVGTGAVYGMQTDLLRKYGETYIDSGSAFSAYNDAPGGGRYERKADSLAVWDAPNVNASDLFPTDSFIGSTSLIIDGKIAYTINWSRTASLVPKGVSYQVISGNKVIAYTAKPGQFLLGYDGTKRIYVDNPITGPYSDE